MGPAAAYLVPAGVGLFGSLLGAGQQSHAANQAQNAADQAAAGQNAINQQLAQIYNSIFQNYQTNYQPATGPIGQNIQGLAGAAAPATGALSQLLPLLTNPQALNAATGINLAGPGGAEQGAFGYFGNPGATNTQAVGSQALDTFMNPAAAPYSGVTNQLGSIDLGTLTGLGPASAAQSAGLGTTTGAARGLNTLAQSGPVAQQLPGTLGYLNQPGSTNLSGVTPGVLGLDVQTMATGIDPKLISQALAQQDVSADRTMANIQERGGAIPNEAGLLSDVAGQKFASDASLLAQLTGQSQGLKLQAGQAELGAAGGLDSQTMQMLTGALSAAGYGQSQIAQILSTVGGLGGTQAGIGSAMTNTALAPLQTSQVLGNQAETATQNLFNQLGLGTQTAGAMDAQTAQMLMQMLGIGQSAQSGLTGNVGQAVSTGTGIDQLVQGILNSAIGPVQGAPQGLAQIGNQYAMAGGQAAQNLANTQQQNPFSGLATTLAGIKWPTTGTVQPQPQFTWPTTLQPGQLT